MTLKEKNIIITNPAYSTSTLKNLLKKEGAHVFELPMIKTQKAQDNLEIENTIAQIDRFDWLIFTSKNGVKFFFEFCGKKLPAELKIAVIGEGTSNAVRQVGIKPTFISAGRTSTDFLAELKNGIIKKNERILFALGNLATEIIFEGLNEFAFAKRIDVYETIQVLEHNKDVLERTKNEAYDWIFFTSPSAFNELIKLGIQPKQNKMVSIGPTTSAAMETKGYAPALTAQHSTIESMIEVVKNYK